MEYDRHSPTWLLTSLLHSWGSMFGVPITVPLFSWTASGPPIIMGYFQSIVGYFLVWWPTLLGYLAFQVRAWGAESESDWSANTDVPRRTSKGSVGDASQNKQQPVELQI